MDLVSLDVGINVLCSKPSEYSKEVEMSSIPVASQPDRDPTATVLLPKNLDPVRPSEDDSADCTTRVAPPPKTFQRAPDPTQAIGPSGNDPAECTTQLTSLPETVQSAPDPKQAIGPYLTSAGIDKTSFSPGLTELPTITELKNGLVLELYYYFTNTLKKSQKEFARNLIIIGGHTEKPFVCTHEGCTKAFTRKPHLQRHLGSHSGQKDFLCEEVGCGAAFSNKDNLKRHIQRVHQGRKYKCDYEGCGKTFHKHQHLTVHQYVHTNIKPFRCEEEGCEASFLIPSKLKAHMKVHKGYTCLREGCNDWFSKWSELTAHLATHTTEFHCTECTMVFNKKHKLRNHMMVHATEREVFVCPREGCERRFIKRESLRLHISKFHEGARPFSCAHPGCMKTFSYKKSLVQHQVVHEPGYLKPPAKPRKRRSLASRLAGHVDLDESDFLSSPLHTLTFDPGKEDSSKSPKVDTELQKEIPGTSSSGQAHMPSETSSRGTCSKAVTQKPRTPPDETDLDVYAANILLAMQGIECFSPDFSRSIKKSFSETVDHGETPLKEGSCFTNNERIQDKNENLPSCDQNCIGDEMNMHVAMEIESNKQT